MKIALVDPALYTWPYDQALAQGLEAAGHEVTLYGTALTAAESRARPEFLRDHFYRSLNAGFWRRSPPALLRLAKGVAHIAGMRRLVGELERARPDAIHFQWLPLPMLDSPFVRRLRRIAPTVLTVHDTMPFNGSAAPSRLQTMGTFGTFRHFDALIAHTEVGRDLVATHLATHLGTPDRVCHVPHGLLHEGDVDPGSGGNAPPRAADAPVTFLLFGKLKPYKGLDILIRALSLMDPDRRARCRLRVVGKAYMDMAPLEDLARQLGVADRIDFDLRFVSTEELARIFHSADVMVFPYRQIEASGVLMTAIAVGKPVIAAKIGSAVELFAKGKGGILVPREDPLALAGAMRRFVDSPELLASYAAEVRQIRNAIPDWTEIGRRTGAVYDRARGGWRHGAPAARPDGAAGGEASPANSSLH